MKTHSFKEHPYTDIFFDLDRTLWDFERNARETFMDLYHKYQLSKFYESFDTFYETYREYNDELWTLYRAGEIDKETLAWKRFDFTLKDVDVDDEKMARSLAKDYIEISPTKKKLFPHTHLSLTFLKKQYRLHLITNGFKEVQYKKIENSGLKKYFDTIFTSEEVGVSKPNIRFFQHVIQETGAKIEDSLVIGDDLAVDILGAAGAGIDTIWLNQTNMMIEELGLDFDFSPTHEIQSLKELVHIL